MDRGWNDPPMFHCEIGSESTAPPKTKLQLNKRVAYPSMVAPKSDATSQPEKSNPLAEIASSPPRLHPFLKGGPPKAPSAIGDTPITCPIPAPPPPPVAASDSSSASPTKTTSSSSSSLSHSTAVEPPQLTSREKRVKVVGYLRSLTEDLGRKNYLPEKQTCDISKKVLSLEQQWSGEATAAESSEPPLNADAEEKLLKMVEAAELGKWDQALKIQVALAVDHAGMVKKWAMAVKKLLTTAQSYLSTKETVDVEQTQSPPRYFLPSSPNHK